MRGHDVLGQIDQHRAGTAGPGDIKGLADGRHQILGVVDQIVMLGAGPGDADDIHFLKGVVADQSGRAPGRSEPPWGWSPIGGGNAGDAIGGAGAGGEQGDPDFAGGPGIAVGRMDRALLVPDQNMGQIRSASSRHRDR